MDSANILSIIQGLGGGDTGQDPSQASAPPATNVLQAAAAPPQAVPAPVYQDPTAQIAQAATAASPPLPKPRRSLLDTIGRISDVFATVGGAHPLYQPTLDDRAARATAAEDHDLATQKAQIDLATGKFDLSDKQREAGNDERTRFASVLDAVNDPEDAKNLPAMMAAAGLTDARYAPFIKMVQDNPDVAKTLSGALGGGDAGDMGKQIKFGYDSTGKRVAFTVDGEGKSHILEGVTPDESVKVVNTGDKTSLIGPNGQPISIIPNKIAPNTAATIAQSNTNNIRTTTTSRDNNIRTTTVQANKGPGGKNPNGTTDFSTVDRLLNNIQRGFDDLHGLGALPGDPNTPAATLEGAFGRTALGQRIGEQFNNPSAQKRLEIQKDLKSLQTEMIKSLPGSATRTKFEQEQQAGRLPDPSKMSYATARQVIEDLRGILKPAPVAAAPKSALPAGWENAPTVSPSDAAKLHPGTKYVTLDGRALTRP